ncbi:helix-turn-helix domain-containing protein [Rhodococcus sp. NPDC058505]|uniref:helix-turn-helix domain-containing protein n=1 Tax=Rhodococcus sp. NPDC058505 TaxID=3346531 RepID=UPI00365D4F3B
MHGENVGALTERFAGGISMAGRDGLDTLSGMCRFSADDPSTFAATMISVDLGSVRVNRMRSTAVAGVRGSGQLHDPMSGYVAVACILAGSIVLEQNQSVHRVNEGDALCVDFGRPLAIDIAEGSDLVFAYLPRPLVLSRSVDPRRFGGAALPGSVTGAVLAGMLGPLTARRMHPGEVALIEHAVVDLAVAVLREAHPFRGQPEDGASGLRSRVHEVIEQNFTDPAFSVEQVAATVNVSSRYLHKVMESEEQSVYGLIRRRRVRCGVDLLADPSLSGLSIGQIARRSGFAGLSQFGRAVRAVTGTSPRELRRRATGTG